MVTAEQELAKSGMTEEELLQVEGMLDEGLSSQENNVTFSRDARKRAHVMSRRHSLHPKYKRRDTARYGSTPSEKTSRPLHLEALHSLIPIEVSEDLESTLTLNSKKDIVGEKELDQMIDIANEFNMPVHNAVYAADVLGINKGLIGLAYLVSERFKSDFKLEVEKISCSDILNDKEVNRYKETLQRYKGDKKLAISMVESYETLKERKKQLHGTEVVLLQGLPSEERMKLVSRIYSGTKSPEEREDKNSLLELNN